MRTREFDRSAIFLPIRGAAEITGFSTKYLRDGCRAGRIPHVRVGSDYRVDMPLFLAQLRAESRAES